MKIINLFGERERKSSVSFLSFCSFVATHFVGYCLCSNRFWFFLLCLFNNCLLCNSTILFRILHGRDPTRPFVDCRSTWKQNEKVWYGIVLLIIIIFLYMKWPMLKWPFWIQWELGIWTRNLNVFGFPSLISFRIVQIFKWLPILGLGFEWSGPFQKGTFKMAALT